IGLLMHEPLSVQAAAKNTPQRFSMPEFKAMIEQAVKGAASDIGPARDATTGAILGINGADFYRFANATIGWVPGASMIDMVGKTEEDGHTCSRSNFSKDLPGTGARGIILATTSYTCTKDGQSQFLGFVLFVNEGAKAGHLFWVTGTGGGISDA